MIEQYLKLICLYVSLHSIFFIEITLALILTTVSLFFFKRPRPAEASQQKPDTLKKAPIIITSQDIKAIAGEDVITTQLDLARAYMEIGKKKLAKKILDHVVQHGTSHQQQTAQRLIMNL